MDNSDDLYDQNPNENTGASDSPAKKEDEGEYETFLAPKSAWGGKSIEVDQEYIFKVTGIHDAEVELQYSTAPPHKEEAEPAMKDESDSFYE